MPASDVVTIKRIPQDTSLVMLGVKKAGDLNERDELKHLLAKTEKFTKSVVACPIRVHEIWTAYNTIYLASVTYPLASTSFLFDDLEELHKTLFPRLLSWLGYQSSFPRKVVFGPKEFGGIEAKDLEGEQGGAKIQATIKHIRNESTIGQANQILIQWAQMQAGTPKPILEDTQDIPYIKSKYIVTLRKFMKQIQATIKEENPWTIPSTREHDKTTS